MIPVTIGLLEWLAANLRFGRHGKPRDHDEVRVWIAIVLGYFFLLRVSEVLELRQEDVQARRGDEWCTEWFRADSVTVLIRVRRLISTISGACVPSTESAVLCARSVL
jgi:integrase